MPSNPERLKLESPANLTTRLTDNDDLFLTRDSRALIEKLMIGRTEATIDMPLSSLEIPDSNDVWVTEITVAVRGTALVLLTAKGEAGPIALPAAPVQASSAEPPVVQKKLPPAAPKKPAAQPSPKLLLDVQVSSDLENEIATMIRRLEPTGQRKDGGKVHWTTHLLRSAESLTKKVRASSEALPPPRHTQSAAGGRLSKIVRRVLGREPLQTKIDVSMPSVVASVLVRIMENTDAGGGDMDALRSLIAQHMTTVASGALPNTELKPTRDLQKFAQFILSLKPKDVPEELGHTNRAARTPAELIRILSGNASAKIGDVKANGLTAQQAALREVLARSATLARARVPDGGDQRAYDAEIGDLLQKARLSTVFGQLKEDEKRTVGGRLDQAAKLLAKRQNVRSADVTKSVLAKARGDTKISPDLRPQQ